MADPFSDTCLYTYRAAWRVKANVGHHASGCFPYTYIFSNILVTGFCMYPEHTPTPEAVGRLKRDQRRYFLRITHAFLPPKPELTFMATLMGIGRDVWGR